ncbi:MAG TPA: GNAT family N-acetyltransferase [Beijerinckiaceae bacterium]|jgi:predicted N-acyltransferase
MIEPEQGEAKPEGAWTVRVAPKITAVPAPVWDALATHAPAGEDQDNPFVRHAFLSALEEAGCVGRGTGWSSAHLVAEAPDGTIAGVAPCYLKTHSQGEYVFDYAWADAYERAGGRYYPKLQVSVPFTPVTGPRFLADARNPQARLALAEGLRTLRAQAGASSAHVTFLPEADWEALAGAGYLQRTDQQFHWFNEGYASFEDFLGALASRKRKAIRRERRDALSGGLTVEALTGPAIEERHWDAFYRFYMDTGSRKWGRPYLNRRFFSLVGERMADRILLVMARREGRYVAGALNFIGGSRLYGRNWGCIEDHPFLHFELCYYQAIDFAIARGLDRVEAGAQGEHKLARGYRPVTTYSAHEIGDPGLRRAVAAYLERERLSVAEVGSVLAEATPFRRGEIDD